MVPLKFGIVWLYEGTVLVDVYAGDCSVAVVHGGVEPLDKGSILR